MSCYMYWDKIKSIANSLNKYENYSLSQMPLEDIIPILDSVEEIAHDKVIDFDSAKHILDDKKMREALQVIRKFYVYLGTRLETDMAQKILSSSNPCETLKSFHFYERYLGLLKNENQLVMFTPDEKVVFIGGGPLPLTLILLNQQYKTRGISIEIIPVLLHLHFLLILVLRQVTRMLYR